MTARLELAHLPTPLEHPPRLSSLLGAELWVKRDDATGGAEAGNKIRKLELLLADAVARGADTLITCGGIQSNHARATAILGARLGMRAVLVLRDSAATPADPEGNVLLDRLVGAEIRRISAADYARRDAIMAAIAAELCGAGATPYVIPEGGSNGLGALGYVAAMQEVRAQLDALAAPRFDVIVHACGSGGTAAGVALGAERYDVAGEVVAMAVCDDSATFTRRIAAIMDEARALDPSLGAGAALTVDDAYKGEAYAVSSPAQRQVMIEVARASGLILDPVYTGKAFFGLWQKCREAGVWQGKRLLFLHTGGLPGLLAQASTFASMLA